MIESLTKEQTDRLSEYREKWVQIGLSCEPCDKVKSVQALNLVYKARNLTPPKIILVMDSPISGIIASLFLKKAFGKSAEAQVRDQVRAQVGGQVWGQVWGRVGDQVGAQVEAQVGGQVEGQVFGSHDAGWLAFYDFFWVLVIFNVVSRYKVL